MITATGSSTACSKASRDSKAITTGGRLHVHHPYQSLAISQAPLRKSKQTPLRKSAWASLSRQLLFVTYVEATGKHKKLSTDGTANKTAMDVRTL